MALRLPSLSIALKVYLSLVYFLHDVFFHSILPGCVKVSPGMLFIHLREELSEVCMAQPKLVNSQPGCSKDIFKCSSRLFGWLAALSFWDMPSFWLQHSILISLRLMWHRYNSGEVTAAFQCCPYKQSGSWPYFSGCIINLILAIEVSLLPWHVGSFPFSTEVSSDTYLYAVSLDLSFLL